MIIDSHCHAWAYWPYNPPTPDPEWRGRIEQLLHEMALNGVAQAVLICAQIDHNPDNNAYVAEQARRFPAQVHQFVDLDSEWSPTYHQPGAAERLRRMAAAWPIKGFTHYLRRAEDGAWLTSAEGLALFQAAADLGLIASLSCYPHQQAAVRQVARRFPQTPILCHHMGWPTHGLGEARQNLDEVLASAECPNIYIKLSGFAYAAQVAWEYPYREGQWIVRALYDRFGPRLCWGSDYPVVRFYMTYRQALEAFRTHCDFISPADQALIAGGTLASLLGPAAGASSLRITLSNGHPQISQIESEAS